jgi:hypothetical protein
MIRPQELITASNMDIMRQAGGKIGSYADNITSTMGEDWVEKNPQAFAILVQACAIEASGSVLAREIQRVAIMLEDISQNVKPDPSAVR